MEVLADSCNGDRGGEAVWSLSTRSMRVHLGLVCALARPRLAREPGEVLTMALLRERGLVKWLLAYAAGAWVLLQVLGLLASTYSWPALAMRTAVAVAVLGLLVALVLAWYHGERGVQRVTRFEAMLLVLIVTAGGAAIWHGEKRYSAAPPSAPEARQAVTRLAGPASRVGALKSIAVLPFVSMSREADNEYFSDGLSEEILNSLSRIDGMQVVARTSSFQFKGRNEDLRNIGHKLGVAAVLEGSVRREGNRARITAQLIRTADGIHLWSQTYDRKLVDTLAVQLDIAEQVASALNVLLDDAQRTRMRADGVHDVDAFIAFQKGVAFFEKAHDGSAHTVAALAPANEQFDRAVALEPGFALAHFESADRYEHQMLGDSSSPDERMAARREALRRIGLALAASHDLQQRLFMQLDRKVLSDDWSGLPALIESALAAPGCASPNWLPQFAEVFGYAKAYLPLGARVVACDPLNASARLRYAEAANHAGLFALALASVDRADADNVGSSSQTLQAVRALAALGRISQARARLGTVEPAGELYAITQVALDRAAGTGLPETQARLGKIPRASSRFDIWSTVDLVAAALCGDRQQANRIAASYDARPGGSLVLALGTGLCQCGAPFDLAVTPNFRARLAESRLPWPPATYHRPTSGPGAKVQ